MRHLLLYRRRLAELAEHDLQVVCRELTDPIPTYVRRRLAADLGVRLRKRCDFGQPFRVSWILGVFDQNRDSLLGYIFFEIREHLPRVRGCGVADNDHLYTGSSPVFEGDGEQRTAGGNVNQADRENPFQSCRPVFVFRFA